jgi:hypothetical protein
VPTRSTSTTIAEAGYSGGSSRDLAEAGAHDQGDAAADDQEERRRGQRATAAHEQPGGDQRDAGGCGDHEGLEDQPELRDVEVVLALEHRHAQQQAADRGGLADEAHGAAGLHVAVVGGEGAVALLLEHQQADDRQARGADQHQVRRAPRVTFFGTVMPDIGLDHLQLPTDDVLAFAELSAEELTRADADVILYSSYGRPTTPARPRSWPGR